MDLFNYQLKCTILLTSFQLQLFRWAKSSKNWIKNNPGMGQTKAMRFCIFNTCQLNRLTRGGGVFLGILGGGVPPDSPNPDPISYHKNVISTPFFRPT